MKLKFYTDQIHNQTKNIDFKEEQSEFSNRSKVISEVQEEYKLYIEHYLKKDQSKWVDAPLFDFIDANWDQQKVITYIDYELKDNPEDLPNDDLIQLKNLKTILEKKDYKEKVPVFPNNVNFWIIWWKYIEKNWSETKIKMQNIKKLRKNVYKILLQKKWSKIVDKYEIHYDSTDYVSIYDQFWTRLWRELIKKDKTIFIEWNKYRKQQYQTEWMLTINTPKNNIELNLVFVS